MKIIILLFLIGVGHFSFGQVKKNEEVSKLTSAALIEAAQKKAKKKGKKVMVKYTATWCGWCHKMDTAMADKSVAKYFDDNYVVVRLNVMESGKNVKLMPQGSEALLKEHGGINTGIPYWVVLDSENKVVANSKDKAADKPLDDDGENVGCPAKDTEVAYFIRVLKATGSFSDAAIEKIKKRFEAID